MARTDNEPQVDEQAIERESPVRRAHARTAEREGRASAPGYLGVPLDEVYGAEDELRVADTQDDDQGGDTGQRRSSRRSDRTSRPRTRGEDGDSSGRSERGRGGGKRSRKEDGGSAARSRSSKTSSSSKRASSPKAGGAKRGASSTKASVSAQKRSAGSSKASASKKASAGSAKRSASSRRDSASSAKASRSQGKAKTAKPRSERADAKAAKPQAKGAKAKAARQADAATGRRSTSKPRRGGGASGGAGGGSGSRTKSKARREASAAKRGASKAASVAEEVPDAVGKKARKQMRHAAFSMTKKALVFGARKSAQGAARAARRAGRAGAEAVSEHARKLPIQRSVDVAVPVEVAWDQWLEFEHLPEGANRVSDVERDGDTLFGRLEGVARSDWEAEVLDEREHESFAWRSTEGSDSAGLVTFHPLGERLTRIELELDIKPVHLLEAATLATHIADRRVESELRSFKADVELISPDVYEELLSSNGSGGEHDEDDDYDDEHDDEQ
ncbi:MAG TPA: SRPBCC family protein [Solirubrobacteraceae bacterium]|nr:SRPBCC family protein [Solirubrobacteraceae bacterium]